MLLVPFKEHKTQRSVILPDRLWEFLKKDPNVLSYSDGLRTLLEEAYKKAESEK